MNRAINDCSIAKEGAAIVHTYMNRNETATQGYHKKQMTKKAKRNLLVTLGIIFAIGLYFSPLFAKIIILIVAAGHFYYFLFRIKTVDEQDSMEFENECE